MNFKSITNHIGKTAFVAGVFAANMYTCTNGFQQPYNMQNKIVSTTENPTNNPKILVIDCFEKSNVDINNDETPDVPHGEVVSTILGEKLPNADIYKRNISYAKEYEFTENLDTLLAGILKRNEKFDAINISLACEVSFETLTELLGFHITGDNILKLKDRVRDSLATSLYVVNGDPFKKLASIINKIDSAAINGNKIYVAAGNNGPDNINLLTLADKIEVVGSCDEFDTPKEYSANSTLVTRYEPDEYPVEATSEGFDITSDGKTDFPFEKMAFPWFATKQPREICLHGTSFATPNAIIKDLKNQE